MTDDQQAALALVEEMDASRPRPGQRCHACTKTTPVQRAFIRLAREHGHSYRAIAKKFTAAFGLPLHETSIQNHIDNDHASR